MKNTRIRLPLLYPAVVHVVTPSAGNADPTQRATVGAAPSERFAQRFWHCRQACRALSSVVESVIAAAVERVRVRGRVQARSSSGASAARSRAGFSSIWGTEVGELAHAQMPDLRAGGVPCICVGFLGAVM